jgi:hypothetical protein
MYHVSMPLPVLPVYGRTFYAAVHAPHQPVAYRIVAYLASAACFSCPFVAVVGDPCCIAESLAAGDTGMTAVVPVAADSAPLLYRVLVTYTGRLVVRAVLDAPLPVGETLTLRMRYASFPVPRVKAGRTDAVTAVVWCPHLARVWRLWAGARRSKCPPRPPPTRSGM